MKKRLLKNLMLVMVMAILCFAVAVTASATDESDFTYTVSDETEGVIITSYLGDGGDVVIPDYLGGYPVIAIGDEAFSTITGNENNDPMQTSAYKITSIVIPNSVVSIGEGAFYRAAFDNWYGNAFGFKKVSDLTVILGSGVENISASAFWCSYISNSGEEGRVKINILFPGTEDEWKELDCSAEYFEDMSDGLDIYAASYNDINVVTFNSCTYPGSNGIHNFYDWVVKSEATDTNDGLRIGYCWCGATCEEIIHRWYSDDAFSCTAETFTYYCYNCDAEKTEPNDNVAEHDWFRCDYELEDCEEGLWEAYACWNCGESRTEIFEPADHVWYENGREEPTCGNSGYIFYRCENCYTTKNEDIPATGNHTLVWYSSGDATCTEDGTKFATCKNCKVGELEYAVDEGSALGHNFNENWSVLTTATCSQSGIVVRACKRCAEIESQVESAYGHYDNDFNGKCDECSVVLENSDVLVPDNTTPDTPDEPVTDVPEEETNNNPFSGFLDIIMNFIQQIKEFFNNIFK